MNIERGQNQADEQFVYDSLIAFNADMMPDGIPRKYEKHNLILRDGEGRIRGGLLAYLAWNWVHVDILWVDESLRGQGHGSRLLECAEQFAVEQGCECIELDTYSFQAPEFYKRKGYHEYGKMEYAGGRVVRHYLVKRLAGVANSSSPFSAL